MGKSFSAALRKAEVHLINIMLTKCAGFSQDDNQNEQDFSQDAAQRSAVWRKIVFLNR